MTILQDFYYFLKKPDLSKPSFTILQKSWKVMQLVCISIILSLFLSTFGIRIVQNLTDFNVEDSSVISDFFSQNNPFEVFLLVVIIGPLLEELIFRLPLSKQKLIFFLGGSFTLAIIGLTIINQFGRFWNQTLEKNLGLSIGDFQSISYLIWICFIVISVIILLGLVNKEKVNNFLEKNISWMVYISSLVFGLYHLTNFEDLDKAGLLSVLLVLPQISIGFVFAFIRLRLGFLWTFLGHAIYNLFISGGYFILLLALNQEKIEILINNLNNGISLENSFTQNDIIAVGVAGLFMSFVALAIFLIAIFTVFQSFKKPKVKEVF